MRKHAYSVIMAGGIGSRFWPLSRSSKPKQFLDILNTGKTLIQETYERFKSICPEDHIYIVTNEEYIDLVLSQLPGITLSNIIAEPIRRNTAPCIAYACQKISLKDPHANIVVSPADHYILNSDKYLQDINFAIDFVNRNDSLVTLGIRPSRPDTGYGYIQFTEMEGLPDSIKKVKTFTEKPTKEIAESFIKSGDFLWNSGMFVWNVQTILRAFKDHLPEMISLFNEDNSVYGTVKEESYIKNVYSQCSNISIDYGIMEKAENVFVIPSDFGWSDVGTWGSIFDIYTKDYLDNAVDGKLVQIYDSSNNMISVSDEKLVVIQGAENFCIIDTKDVLLICKKENEQEIKQITNDLKRHKLDMFL